jgi:hypothetical protein
MSNQLFDQFLKEKLDDYDSGAPMHVWERIREKEKDDKKVFFWWKSALLIGFVLLSVSAIGYFAWNAGSKKIITATNENTNTTVNENTKSENETIAQTNSSSNSSAQENSDTNNGVRTIAEVKESKTQKEISETADMGLKNDQPTKISTPISTGKKDLQKASKQNISVGKDRSATGSGAQHSSATSTNKATISQPIQNNTTGNYYSISLVGNELQRNYLPFGVKPGTIAQNNQKPTCPTINGPRRNDWYLEVYGSPDYTMRSFSNSSPVFNNYISYRKENEDSRNGFSAGVRIAKNLGEKTVLKTGINYSQINERLQLVTQNEKQITQIVTIRTIIRGIGDTLFIRDTSYFEQSGTRYRTTYNRYRFIDIPVLFSYEFGNPDIVSFAINAGPVINVTSFYRGEVLDTLLRPVKISTNTGVGVNNWRNNIGLGVIASFSVYKRINSNMQIFAEPYFRYNFKPVSQNINLVNQRYSISGMQLGIRYKFNSTRQRYRY